MSLCDARGPYARGDVATRCRSRLVCSRELLAHSSRRVRAHQPDHEVDDEADDGDLEGEHQEPEDQTEEKRQNAEHQSEQEQSHQCEQSDGEDRA